MLYYVVVRNSHQKSAAPTMIGLAPILCYSFVALARLPVNFAFQPLGYHSLPHKYWPCRKSTCRNNDAERFGRHLLLRTKPSGDDEDDDEGERLFFDDFGDGFVGSAGAASSSSSFTSSLSERITSAKKDEEVTSAKLAKNWKTGNWGVRGFILDSSDPIRESVADVTASSTEGAGPRLGGNDMRSSSALEVPPIHVSTIVADQSHMHDEGYEVEVIDRIAVGRSDGSVVIVKLGTAYMTKFTAVPKLRVDDSWGDNNNEASTEQDSAANGGPSVRVETELVNSDDVQRDLGDITDDYGEGDRSNNIQYPMEDPFDALYGSGNAGSNVQQQPSTQESQLEGTPFEILFQFSAHDNEPISALLFVNDVVFSAAGNTGDIRTWSMPGDNDDAKMMPGKTLSDAHSDRIVALKILSSSPDAVEPDLLLSASRDGSFALWDLNSGDLVTRCQMFADGSGSITCADVDTSGVDGDVIFFGLDSGHVNGYYVNDVIGSASVGDICPIPSSRFQANDGGVTAILAAGQGTSMSSSLQQARPTTILLTGGIDGMVKQW